jgi:arylsulfatase A-like enzyme
MPPVIKSLSSAVASLWFRLIGVAIFALVFAEALHLASGQAQGWSFYLTGPEIAFEVVVRLVAVALVGVVLGTILTAAVTPFLWHADSARERLIDRATKVAVGLAVFGDSFYTVVALIGWSKISGRPVTIVLVVFLLGLGAALCSPRGRKEMVTSLGGILGEKATRRTAMATGLGAAALVVTEFAMGKTAPAAVRAAAVSPRPKPNILLITFDALSAEDMSLYGYRLPTTPNIDAFARQSTVFTNFYSGSTFTTPSVATILTGLYPSESHVYQLPGRLPDANGGKSLPHLMRAAGYATGASISNPAAYYLAAGLASDYDSLPEGPYRSGKLKDLWDATEWLHQRSPVGGRLDEYWDLEAAWDFVPRHLEKLNPRRFGRFDSGYPPAASFDQAREILAKLPDGYFLWVHVMAPHGPYLPDPADRGRFLATDEVRTDIEQNDFPWMPHYTPDQQAHVDKVRLRYDEFIVSLDRAFGAFMSDLEREGRLKDTATIVSADHGESFEGGDFFHVNPDQTRPTIHIPLIIRTPGQQEGRRVATAADQSALAPTILNLAGQPQPKWMPGRSLTGWLNGDGQGVGLAFTEYLNTDSIYGRLRNGTVGVIDGQYQYLLDLATGKGILRPLSEAQNWNVDRSAEFPEAAAKLRAAIYARFPDLPHRTG